MPVFSPAAGLDMAAEKIRSQRYIYIYIYARLFSTIYTPELQLFIWAYLVMLKEEVASIDKIEYIEP